MTRISALIDQAVSSLAVTYRGPGGAVAIIREGEVLVRHAWGYADLDRRIAMTPQSLMPICSVTKQFVCGLMLHLFPDPSVLDADLVDWLPHFEGRRPSARELGHNQSGLRDYWTQTILHGAMAEGVFTAKQARELITRTRTGHFEAGTRYSYSNGNFHILGEMLAARMNRDLGELLTERLLAPAGMETARLAPDTAKRPGTTIGYEGNSAVGFFPAVNRIWWAGDAGMVAALDDMIAWERHIDRTMGDATSIYSRISAPQTFRDGTPAHYGFGLAHADHYGVATIGHGGALRGWRCHRVHVPSERLSVVVMFNHEANARAAAFSVLDAALGREPVRFTPGPAGPAFVGNFMDPEGGISATLTPLAGGGIDLRYGTGNEKLTPMDDVTARNDQTVLTVVSGGLRMQRAGDNLDVVLTPLAPLKGNGLQDASAIEGTYHSDELGADLLITLNGGLPHVAFTGFLGEGAIQPLYPLSPDCWLMPVRRSMDAPAPGEFTLRFEQDGEGKVSGVTAGCWLARHNHFKRV